MPSYPKPSEPHQFVISDEDLFFGEEPTTKDVRTVNCYVCGNQPGQGMHAPPPPPVHKLVIAEVAKTLASFVDKPHDPNAEAARAAFTTVQRVRARLEDMSKDYTHEDGGSFYAIDQIGWHSK